jgi:hypothetical protein
VKALGRILIATSEPIVWSGVVEQRLDLASHRSVVGASHRKKRGAFRGRLGERLVIELLDALPAFRRHAAVATHLAFQPRLRQPPITFADTFRTAAVSSTLNPPKNRISMTRLLRSFNFASGSSTSSSATRSGPVHR